MDTSHNDTTRRNLVDSSAEWVWSSARQWVTNEDVGIPIDKCGQREVGVSCLRLCRSVVIDGEKETRHNLKHATRDQRQKDRAPGVPGAGA